MNRDRFAFIIRIWHEAESEDSPIRGSIQLVSSDKKVYFSSLDDVPDLMRSFEKFGETDQKAKK